MAPLWGIHYSAQILVHSTYTIITGAYSPRNDRFAVHFRSINRLHTEILLFKINRIVVDVALAIMLIESRAYLDLDNIKRCN